MTRSPAPWLAAFLAASTLLAQESPRVVQLRSLRPLASAATQPGCVGFTSAIPNQSYSDHLSIPNVSLEVQPATWAANLLARLRASEIESGQLLLERQPAGRGRSHPSLLIAGTADAAARCTADLDRMAAIVGRPIVVEAWRLPLADGALPATVCTPHALKAHLDAAPPLWHARVATRPGGEVRLCSEQREDLLLDVVGEVAQDAAIHTPLVDATFAGLRVGLAVHALPGDRLLLEGDWMLSERVAVHEASTGDKQSPTVDLPEHRTAYLSFAGRVPSGGALLVSGRGGSDGPAEFLLVVSARYDSPPPPKLADTTALRNVTALTGAPYRFDLPTAFGVRGMKEPLFGGGEAGTSSVTADRLAVFLGMASGATVGVIDGLAVVEGTPDALARCGTQIDQLLEVHSEAIEVRGRVEKETRGRTRKGNGTEICFAQPTLRHRTAQAFVGRERSHIWTHTTRTVAGAAMHDPQIGHKRSGLWSRTIVADGDVPHVEGRWQVVRQTPFRERFLKSTLIASMQLGETSIAFFPWNAPLTINEPQVLGMGPGTTPVNPPVRVVVELRELIK